MSLDITLTVKADTGNSKTEIIEVYESNITHNLSKMACEVGVYDSTWAAWGNYANTSIIPVRLAILKLKDDPAKYDKFNNKNGWGTRMQLIEFLTAFLVACESYPNATIIISI